MILKKALLTIILLSVIIITSYAQSTISDANGRVLTSTKNDELEGSPYLYNEWKSGNVKMGNGTVYSNSELKLDLLENHLIFKGSNDEPLMFSEPVKEFTLFPDNEKTHGILYRNGFDNDNNFYEVLLDGKTQLLKLHKKSIGEKAAYASSNSVKMILDAISYSIFKSGSLSGIKKDKKSILTTLNDKASELENYIKSNRLNLKEEGDLIKIVSYYNTL